MKFPNKSNRKLAEFIGILLGDGSISIKEYRVQITLHKNEINYAIYISRLIIKLFNIKPKIRFRKNENALDIRIFSKQFVDFLLNEIGLVPAPKWNRAVIPDYYIGSRLDKYILRGYFDTDGSIVITNNNGTIYPRLEMKVCPSPMKNSLIKILKRRNFRFGAYNIENNRTRIQMNGYSQLFKWIKEIGIKNTNQLNKIKKLIAGHGLSGFNPFEPYPRYG